MAFYDCAAQHRQSLRTTNPIESTFGTIRHRTKRCKGCLSRDGMLHMMFKLSQCAEKNWRKLRGFNYLAKVIELESPEFSTRSDSENVQSIKVLSFGNEFREVMAVRVNQEKFRKGIA